MTRSRSLDLRSFADGTGLVGSAACVAHCITVPLFLVAGTAIPVLVAPDETFHRAMIAIIVPAALLAFGLGCAHHKDIPVVVLGLLGRSGLVSSGILDHATLGETGDRILTFGASGLLIAAHLRNFRLCRGSACDHDRASA